MPILLLIAPRRAGLGLAALLLLGACASTTSTLPQRPGIFSTMPGSAGSPSPPISPSLPGTPVLPRPGEVPATALATEQRFLEDWFRGTPVVIAARPPSLLQVDVPLAHSFDSGKADIKPALNAVLDRVAQSLRRQAGSRLLVVAPADYRGSAELAQARAERVRDALGSKGIAATLVDLIESPVTGGPVQLRLTMPGVGAQPIARGRDSGFVVSSSGVKAVSAAAWRGWTTTQP
jgi:outer membrane protein OmpA-like peptidoglycan-associated protein